MRGAILQKEKMFYTYMDKVFTAINNIQLNYNWLITNYECNCYPDETILYNKDYVWISGEELTKIVYSNKIQFIWGAFSAFDKSILQDNVLKYPLPYSDSPDFWIKDFKIQHPLAEIEIVPWDSGLVLLISNNDEIVDTFLKKCPLAEDLSEYNARFLDS